MEMSLTVPDQYGYVLLVLVLAFVVFMFLGEMVVYARKKFDVPYPTMYSEKSKQFNCYQRAHQNGLESLPFFIVFTLLGGLQYPLIVTVGGVVWCVGRLIYAYGYYSGEPSKRAPGAILASLGLLATIVSTISLALHVLSVL